MPATSGLDIFDLLMEEHGEDLNCFLRVLRVLCGEKFLPERCYNPDAIKKENRYGSVLPEACDYLPPARASVDRLERSAGAAAGERRDRDRTKQHWRRVHEPVSVQ